MLLSGKKWFAIFLAFEFKNRTEEDTFEAHGKSSKAELLGNSSCERKVQGPSVCHQCPLKALGGAGGRWHPEAVYFMVSLKMSERGPWRPHFITALSGPAVCWLLATRRWKASEQLWLLWPVPGVWGITVTLFLETAPEVEEALPVGPSFPPSVQIEVRQEVGQWPSRWTQPRLDEAKYEP